ncbi:hypothetical protein QFZ32_000327 [Streptomyces canus]|nr:hypothetical protein [Streptomyces canus]
MRATARLARRLRAAGGLRLARTLILPVRRMGEEEFRGHAAYRLLLAGNALHADLAPESAGSGGFGWLVATLGQTPWGGGRSPGAMSECDGSASLGCSLRQPAVGNEALDGFVATTA